MNNFPFPPLNRNSKESLDELSEKIYRENIKALKKIFKDDIKESFLISVFNNVQKKYVDILDYYPNEFDLSPTNLIINGDAQIDYDICCHIVGIHKFNMLFLPESTRGEYQKNPKYISELSEQVHNHIKLRQFGSSFFRTKALMTGDKFLFFPIGYDMFVATTYLFALITEDRIKQNRLFYFYQSMLNECVSILTLIENGLLLQVYPQARNLIELYFKYEVLSNKPDAIQEYYDFCNYEIEFNCCSTFNEEFLKKYEGHKEVDKINYLHFGWIDKIFDFNYLEDGKKYSIPGLYNYLKMIRKNEANIDELKKLHNICHSFSHGSTISKTFPIHSYFELMPVLYNILRVILKDICDYLKIQPIINDIDIMKKMEKDWKLFIEKKEMLTVDRAKIYYGLK